INPYLQVVILALYSCLVGKSTNKVVVTLGILQHIVEDILLRAKKQGFN
ncbi:hypothetical protein CSHISOI_11582, partial [Colletotrichum shisoi]